jgi:sulfite oxidase
MHERKPVKGLQWESGAISTAIWSGVRLRDVLAKAGYDVTDLSAYELPHGVAHVCFDGAEGYGASVPAEKVFDPRGDVLIAYEMNGKPIPRDHGYPLRAVIPGYVAARSVKWLSKITLSSDESTSHWQQRDYKGFSPSADLNSSDYGSAFSIQELPVQSAIVSPKPEQVISPVDSSVTVKGYAIAGGGRAINRVDVSSDGGLSWTEATLYPPLQKRGRTWAWTQWEAKFPTKEGTQIELVCKAVDESYNTQPEGFEGVYNVRGVLVSAWQRIKMNIKSNSSTS